MKLDRLDAFRQRIYKWNPEYINTGWEDILVAEGLVSFSQAFNDPKAVKWVDDWVNHHLGIPVVEESFFIHSYTRAQAITQGIKLYDYCGNWGAPIALVPYILNNKDKEHLTKDVVEVAEFIMNKSDRYTDGTICHGAMNKGFWVDTLYYSSFPLAKAYTLVGEKKYAQEALRQCYLHAKYLRDPLTGLFFHDYNPENKQVTPGFWARGNGWVIMTFAEVLSCVDEDMEYYEEVRGYYLDLVAALLRYRHPSGLWRIVPENPESHLETSGSAMIALGIAQGIQAGLLSDLAETAVLGTFQAIETWISVNPYNGVPGCLMGSQLPAGEGGWDTHKTVPIGESTYTNGIFLKLMAKLQTMGIINIDFTDQGSNK